MPDFPLWDANRDLRTHKTQIRHTWIDLETESVIVRDSYGIERFSLSELPGKLLTFLMLYGLRRYFRDETKDHRTLWLAWKNGLMPRIRKKKRKPIKPDIKLSLARQAIVNALQDLPGCEATIAQTEAMVRAMTPRQVELWTREPDVIMQLRLLKGDRPRKLDTLLDQIS